MRKLKAVYLIPVFVVLAIGLAAGGYYMMIVPQITKTNTAQKTWNDAKTACPETMETEWAAALEAQRTDAKKLWDDQQTFAAIQAQMPEIYDMAVVYGGEDDASKKKAMNAWYELMSKPTLANRLRRWASRFYFGKLPDFNAGFTGPLLFPEEKLPDVKMVVVDLGTQTLWSRGYSDMINQVRRRNGYGFSPLIIQPGGGKITITVHREHPRHTVAKPVLSMDVSGSAYLMMQGWDPNGDKLAVQDLLDQAQDVWVNQRKTTPRRKAFADPKTVPDKYTAVEMPDIQKEYDQAAQQGKPWCECPPVLGFIKAKDAQGKEITP